MSARILDLVSTAPDDLPPRYGSDRSTVAVARVVDLVEGGRQVIVSLYGAPGVQVPATAVDWKGVATAHVLIDPDTGRPVHALGPAPAPEGPLPQIPQAPTPEPVRRRTALTPEWAGTHQGTGWARFNGGGLWQGPSPQGTRLRGLAMYGQQAPALGPITVRRAVLAMRPASYSPPWAALLQAATHTSQGPAPTGPTITASMGSPLVEADITALAPALLAGTGIALVGTSYGGVGVGGDSMAVLLDYEENTA